MNGIALFPPLPTCVMAATAVMLVAPARSHGQDPKGGTAESPLEETLSTLRFGAGLLYEAAAFSQDAECAQQFDLQPHFFKSRIQLVF